MPLSAFLAYHFHFCAQLLARPEASGREQSMKCNEALKQQGNVVWNIANLLRGSYEVPFNHHFYEYEPPRPLDAIEADIEKLEGEIMAMLKEVTA